MRGFMRSDGTGRRLLTYRHPDPLVETVRFAICEGELLQSIGRGRGVRRTAETPLDVLVLTDVPLPLPVDVTVTWKDLCDGAGPIDVLVAKGVVPLDYNGIAAALPRWFPHGKAAMEWFLYRTDAKAMLDRLRARAERDGRVDISELVGNPNKELSIGNSHQLALYRYRLAGHRQAKPILVNLAMHGDARAAVEVVLGRLDKFEPVGPEDMAANSDRPDRGVAVDPESLMERLKQFFRGLFDKKR